MILVVSKGLNLPLKLRDGLRQTLLVLQDLVHSVVHILHRVLKTRELTHSYLNFLLLGPAIGTSGISDYARKTSAKLLFLGIWTFINWVRLLAAEEGNIRPCPRTA